MPPPEDWASIREELATLKQIQAAQADILKDVKEYLREIRGAIINIETIRQGQKDNRILFERLDGELEQTRDECRRLKNEFASKRKVDLFVGKIEAVSDGLSGLRNEQDLFKEFVKTRLWMIGAIALAALAIIDITIRVLFKI